jgi:pyruvate,water dikinase
MQSTKRNEILEGLAQSLREDLASAQNLKYHPERLDENFKRRLRDFLDCYGNQAWGLANTPENLDAIVNLLLEMSATQPRTKMANTKTVVSLERKYFSVFAADQQDYAGEILDLARVSYQLRDDDNIYLGKIENAVVSAMQVSLRQAQKQDTGQRECINYEDMLASLKELKEAPKKGFVISKTDPSHVLRARQLVGQPASGGIATGKARVISEPRDVFKVKSKEILVCDSIDPNMTFIIPLVAGIVERRGGMLIHGAIIAREYGVPCVTGVPEATAVIHTGFSVTVDGHLGIVTIDTCQEK